MKREIVYVRNNDEAKIIIAEHKNEDCTSGSVTCDCGESFGHHLETIIIVECDSCYEYRNNVQV